MRWRRCWPNTPFGLPAGTVLILRTVRRFAALPRNESWRLVTIQIASLKGSPIETLLEGADGKDEESPKWVLHRHNDNEGTVTQQTSSQYWDLVAAGADVVEIDMRRCLREEDHFSDNNSETDDGTDEQDGRTDEQDGRTGRTDDDNVTDDILDEKITSPNETIIFSSEQVIYKKKI